MNATSSTAGAWRPTPATADDEPERGGERVAGRRRGDADDDARDEAERVLLEALVVDGRGGPVRRHRAHGRACSPVSSTSSTYGGWRLLRRAMRRPDVLVLGGGGVLGEAWLRALLAGLEAESGWDLREVEHFVGTSAGSIVAAALAAGPAAGDDRRRGGGVGGGDGCAAGRRRACAAHARAGGDARGAARARRRVGALAPGGAALRATAAARPAATPGREIPRLRAALDAARRAVRRTAARHGGRPAQRPARDLRRPGRAGRRASTEAVLASCAVPWVFRPQADRRARVRGRRRVERGQPRRRAGAARAPRCSA